MYVERCGCEALLNYVNCYTFLANTVCSKQRGIGVSSTARYPRAACSLQVADGAKDCFKSKLDVYVMSFYVGRAIIESVPLRIPVTCG